MRPRRAFLARIDSAGGADRQLHLPIDEIPQEIAGIDSQKSAKQTQIRVFCAIHENPSDLDKNNISSWFFALAFLQFA